MDQESLNLASNSRIDLALTICKVFRHLEKVPFAQNATDMEIHIYTACFCSCLRYMSKMMLEVSSKPYRGQGDDRRVEGREVLALGKIDHFNLLSELYNILEDYKFVDSIIFQHRPYDRRKEVTQDESACVLSFFSLLATCGDSKMLSLLFYDEIAPLLNEILRAASSSQQGRVRGYKPVSAAKVRDGCEVDPKHENCIKVYQFLAILLRAVTELCSTSPQDKMPKKKCFDSALYCLDCNRLVVRGCLRHVSDAVMSNTADHMAGGHSRTKGYTVQLLRETAAILALVTELCSHSEIDLFRQKYARLYEDISADTRSVVLSTCSFLGASGISRELFQAMTDLEKDNGGSLSGMGGTGARLGFSPVIDVFLSSGRNNTRHEAIQFSHFVSGCSSAVSVTELKQKSEFAAAWMPVKSSGSSPVGNLLQPVELTESSLEQNSRYAMTNKFEFTLEMEAAKCLFHAANTLWVTHPATRSFVSFTPEELARIRYDISWIKVHDIIAYREDNSIHRTLFFGEVEHVDTINLSCHVRPLDDKENFLTVMVPLHRLAGVEDRTKRQGTITFSHAPETSSDLHKSRVELSLGHLILAMRWCHEYAFEEEQQGLPPSPWVRMNAQMLAKILAKEISLTREGQRARPVASEDNFRMLRTQLLDLFGENDEYATFLEGFNNNTVREKGRLGDLIPQPLWGLVRSQLEDELKAAVHDILAVKQEEAQKVQRMQHDPSGFVFF